MDHVVDIQRLIEDKTVAVEGVALVFYKKILKLANKIASNWPTKSPQTGQQKTLKLANKNTSNWPIIKNNLVI